MAAIIPTRAKFIGETLVSATLSSVTVGLTFGMCGAAFLPTGPVVPFIVGSWVGHTFGLWHHYRSLRRSALNYARYYPTIMAHALFIEHGVVVPPKVLDISQQQLDLHRDTDIDVDDKDDSHKHNRSSLIRSGGRDIDVRATKETHAQNSSTDSVSSFAAMTLDRWIEAKGMKMMSFAILASQFCRSDVEELRRQEREKLIADHHERYSVKGTGNKVRNGGDSDCDDV